MKVVSLGTIELEGGGSLEIRGRQGKQEDRFLIREQQLFSTSRKRAGRVDQGRFLNQHSLWRSQETRSIGKRLAIETQDLKREEGIGVLTKGIKPEEEKVGALDLVIVAQEGVGVGT